MAGAPLTLRVLTPDRELLRVPAARKVRVKLEDGAWLSIYPHHAPLIASVLPGPLYYEADGEIQGAARGEILLSGGILRVADDEVVILTQGASTSSIADAPEFQEGARRFDRLARELMHTLGAEARGVVGPADRRGD
jgi:F0F1-type ATP synthase epsilon subunit